MNEWDEIRVTRNAKRVLREKRVDLQRAWSETSYQMQAMRDNPSCAQQEFDRILDVTDPSRHVAHRPTGAPARAARVEGLGRADWIGLKVLGDRVSAGRGPPRRDQRLMEPAYRQMLATRQTDQ